MEMSDDTLVSMVQQGEHEAFAYIVERYKIQIYNLMYRYTESVDEASDLTQDVFCKAYEKLGRYRETKGFFPWLYTMALNHARDWSRKRSRSERKLNSYKHEPTNSTTQPEGFLESKEKALQLQQALALLPEDRREMVILRYRHDCSINDLAEIYSLSGSAVKMRLKRALNELGQNLEQD